MNFNNIKFTIRGIIIYIRFTLIFLMISIILMRCSRPHYPVSPITNIYDNGSSINSSSSTKNLNTLKNINPLTKGTSVLSFPKKNFINNKNDNVNQMRYELVTPIIQTDSNNRIIYNRNYDNIQKGSYSGSTYIVRRGDTLFYIAWITGNNYHDLAKRNKISEPYHLNVGQILKIDNSFIDSKMMRLNSSSLNKKTIPLLNNFHTLPVNQENSKKILQKEVQSLTGSTLSTKTASSSVDSSGMNIKNKALEWRWPTQGKIVAFFSELQGGNKGVDIAGLRGQPIFATAAGKVVYSGNALRGYGNLIIIKHNDDYLSAYAHNDTILVDDEEAVHAGQKIATMGSTGTSSVKLHFEIRYKGKSVNPLNYISH